MSVERPPLSPHLVIRASAGSGKTYRLTTRYLELLRALPDGTGPEAILATTFTRKAAGEILGRIFNRLAEAAENPESLRELEGDIKREAGGPSQPLDAEQCVALLRKLAENLHRVAVGTIDSFFNRVAQSFPFELDLPVDCRLAGEGEAVEEQLRDDAVDALLESGRQEARALLETLLLQQQPGRASRSVAAKLSGLVGSLYRIYLEAPEPECWSALQVPVAPGEQELGRMISALAVLEPDLPRTKAGKPSSGWRKAWEQILRDCREGLWQQAAERGLVAKVVSGEASYYKLPISDAWREPCQVIARQAAFEVLGQLRERTLSAYQLLQQYDGHYRRLQRRQGVVTFNDVTRRLARDLPALGDEVVSDLYYRLDGRISHILVDEFQDTSIDQWSVLNPLVDEVVSTGDRTRSYFCVGDTKQSIYGWRGGCSELFDRVASLYAERGLQQQSLNVSYRSSPLVLQAVNRAFSSMQENCLLQDVPETAERWDAEFAPHRAVEKNERIPGYVRYMTTVAAGGAGQFADDSPGEDSEPDEPDDAAPAATGGHEDFVAEQIETICASSPGRSVGILVRSHDMARKLLHALDSRGVRASGEGGNPLTDTAAVNAVLSAILLADHPGDSAAAFHLAHSPLGPITGLGPDDNAARAAVVSRAIRARLLERGYASVIAGWTRELAPGCDRRSLLRLVQLTVQADGYDAERTLRPADFVAAMKSVRVEQPTSAPVRVMTIHAAKGLEFDIAVLPELHTGWRADLSWVVERAEPAGPVTGVFHSDARRARYSPQLERARHQQLARERFEDLCTLYVAMTRAKNALYLLAPAFKLNRDGSLGKRKSSAALLLQQLVADPAERLRAAQPEQALYEIGDPNWADALQQPTAAATDDLPPLAGPVVRESRRPVRSFAVVAPSSLESAGTVTGRDLLGLGAEEGRRYGSLMHAWLEQVEYLDQEGGVPDDCLLIEIAAREAPGAAEQWLAERLAEFRQILRRPAIAEKLRRGTEAQLWRERSFAVYTDQGILRGVFDRVLIFEDGSGLPRSAVIMDYKTDDVSGDRLGAAIERYRPQLGAYRQALGAMLDLGEDAIECQLLFVCEGLVERV